MKNYIIAFLSILLFFALFLCLCFYSSGERIKKVTNYDISKEHHLIMQESSDYNYCPYCGEYLGEIENKNDD